MTTVVISQPMYFPWPGFFELVACADVYIHLDDAQFSKGSFINRVQVKQPGGAQTWMTVALAGKGAFQEIRTLEPASADFRDSHRALLRQVLRDAPHLAEALALFDAGVAPQSLVEVLEASIERPAAALGLTNGKTWLKSSEMDTPGRSSTRVLDLVKRAGGDRYVTAHGAAGYLEHEAFEAAGVSVDYIDYSLTPYPQQHGAFTPYLSVLDLVANAGPAAGACLHPRTKPWRAFLAEREKGSHA